VTFLRGAAWRDPGGGKGAADRARPPDSLLRQDLNRRSM